MNLAPPQLAGHSLILYDGVCGLCNRLVQFVLRHDRQDHYRFCALQNPLAANILARHGLNPSILDTVYLVTEPFSPGERLLQRSDAALAVLARLGGGWLLLARLFRLAPRSLRNFAYGIVARTRYSLFGRLGSCPLPAPAESHRFLPFD
ncbi:MAG TPA: DCC1-like thiol-disulfide oxidoreductase family protein [Acidisarcina sp.]|nr:DCC1-like thiol-disulfide oxidoreductase family protein [Acidisarcina sp.]